MPLSLAEWNKQKQICMAGNLDDQFSLGFATFYLNRCNRSGVISGAAPIGGLSQKGKWRIGARFYRATLAERIRTIGKMRHRIRISNLDALDFLRQQVVPARNVNNTFAYLDPPYYTEGTRLYLNEYDDAEHSDLAEYLRSEAATVWVASYNNVPFIRDLYSDCSLGTTPVRYSLTQHRLIDELVVASPSLCLPDHSLRDE